MTASAVKLMERNNIDLVLAGVDPLDGEALELLTYVRRKHREVPVILLFPRLHPERAKEALRLGAMAVLKYPVPAAELRAAVLASPGAVRGPGVRAGRPAPPTPTAPQPPGTASPLWHPRPWRRPIRLRPPRPGRGRSIAATAHVHASERRRAGVPATTSSAPQRVELLAREIGLIGNDPSWRQVIDLAATIAATRTSVLIVGEPGTGKSLLARLIHSLGPNPDRPFITVESSAMADELSRPTSRRTQPTPPAANDPPALGQQAGPGPRRHALSRRSGRAAPRVSAPSVPRAAFPRLRGQRRPSAVPPGDARFVMSTSENLPALIEQGRFRQELYHRISVISLMLPPLRHRGTDVELLAESFRAQYAREFHKTVAGFTSDALDVLQKHDWPGNVRELEAAVQRAVALCNGPRITSSHSGADPQPPSPGARGRRGHAPASPPDGSPAPEGSPGRTRESGSSSRPFKPSTGTARRRPGCWTSTAPRSTRK